MKNALTGGIYPMLYSFFNENGTLRLEAFQQQVDAALANGAAGLAILGLGTEVSKLTTSERIDILHVVSRHLDNQKPLLVTVYGNTPEEQIEFATNAIDKGATALLLQPPGKKIPETALFDFFSKVISAVHCPVGIQNAPDFLGYGLTNTSLIKLANDQKNFAIAKLECTAVNLQPVAEALQHRTLVFNGRCGLELTDNLRAGANGLIPAIETIDKTTDIYATFMTGNCKQADNLYTQLAPTVSFIMQGIPHFLTYGKLLAAKRLNIEFGGQRDQSLLPTKFGIECTQRLSEQLGHLPR